MSSVHGTASTFDKMQPHGYVLSNTKDSLLKDPEIRAGLKPTSSDNRSFVIEMGVDVDVVIRSVLTLSPHLHSSIVIQ
jgi:hypothetical protein